MTIIQSISFLIVAVVITGVVRVCSYHTIVSAPVWQHRLLACVIGLIILWSFQTRLVPGLEIHFLGLSIVTLFIGFRWAMLVGTFAFSVTHMALGGNLNIWAIKLLIACYVPILTTYLLYILSFHKLPRNSFVYAFVCAFLAGGVSVALTFALLSGYYVLDGLYSWDVVFNNYLVITPLMVFPEAMFNGMITTILLVHRPHWLYTYHDKQYRQV